MPSLFRLTAPLPLPLYFCNSRKRRCGWSVPGTAVVRAKGTGVKVFVRIHRDPFSQDSWSGPRGYTPLCSPGDSKGIFQSSKPFHIKAIGPRIRGRDHLVYPRLPILLRHRRGWPLGAGAVSMSHHIVEFKNVSYRYPDGTKRSKTFPSESPTENPSVLSAPTAREVHPSHADERLPLADVRNGDHRRSPAYFGRQDRTFAGGSASSFRTPMTSFSCRPSMTMSAFGPLTSGLDRTGCERTRSKGPELVHGLELRDKPPTIYPGDRRALVAIATVMAMDPIFLPWTSPLRVLDPKSRRSLITMLQTFEHSKIHCLPMISILSWTSCHRCIVIREGRVVADGSQSKFSRIKILLEENNLELPYHSKNTANYSGFLGYGSCFLLRRFLRKEVNVSMRGIQ